MNSLDQIGGGLAAGTLVTTPDGDKKIEDVKAGDLVLGGVSEAITSFFEVKKTSAKPYNGPILKITIDSQAQLALTPSHICFGYLHKPIPSGDSIFLVAFDKEKVSSRSHYVGREKQPLEVEYFDNLDKAETAALLMAQADGGVEIDRIAAFVPWTHFRFLPSADLKVGMQIPATKNEELKEATITQITEEQYDGFVYDLDIPEARNFAANGVLVHDSTRVL